jgi:HSP20 family molecular chaperone IbpA
MMIKFTYRKLFMLLSIFAFITIQGAEAKRCSGQKIHFSDKFHPAASLDLLSFPFWSSPEVVSRSRHHQRASPQSSLYSYTVTTDENQTKLSMLLPGFSSQSVKLSLSTKTEPTNLNPVSILTIEPRGETAVRAFQATSFTLDQDVDLNSLSSSMANGVLEVVAQKVKPKVQTKEIPIAEELSPKKVDRVEIEGNDEEPQVPDTRAAADPPSPNDSPGLEVYTEPE